MEAPNDVEMGENSVVETPTQPEPNNAADPTDPLPPPQPQPQPVVQPPVMATEHLSTIQPANNQATALPPTPAAPTAARTGSVPPAQPNTARPEKPALHGGPTRQYLNQNITPHLLEGMKYLAMNEPERPLAWLADFLKDRSKQVEG